MATPGQKVAWLRHSVKPKVSQTAFAEMVGSKRNIIANVELGRSDLDESLAKKLSKKFNKSVDWFFDNRDLPYEENENSFIESVGSASPYEPPAPPRSKVAAPGVGRRLFPILGVAGAASFPLETFPPGDEDEYVEFSDDLFRPDRFAIKILGDSNDPRIKHGSFALIQPTHQPPVGVFVAAKNADSEYLVKILRKEKGRDILQPYNDEFEPIALESGWGFAGYVVGLKLIRGPKKYVEEGDNDGIRP